MSTDRLNPDHKTWVGYVAGWGHMTIGVDRVTGRLCAIDRAGGDHFGGSALLEALCTAFREATTPRPPGSNAFYMVFREGAGAPTFKHDTQALASAEAKRLGRNTGSVTHVLAAVETIRPHAMPTVEEFATHAEEHGMRHNGKEWGMWRVRKDAYQPIIIAVRVDDGKEVASHGFPWNVSLDPWKDAKWFPLASDGSDLRDSIPF